MGATVILDGADSSTATGPATIATPASTTSSATTRLPVLGYSVGVGPATRGVPSVSVNTATFQSAVLATMRPALDQVSSELAATQSAVKSLHEALPSTIAEAVEAHGLC